MLRAKAITLLLLLTLALAAGRAMAQPPASGPAASSDEARALFDKGKQLGKKNDWAASYEAFRRSFELRPSHDTAANLGLAAFKLGKFAEGARHVSFALNAMPTAEAENKRKAVQKILDDIKKEVTTVDLSVDPADAEILVDGTSLGPSSALDSPVFLEPGSHTIEARAEGFKTGSEQIDASKGTMRPVILRLERNAKSSTDLPGNGLPEARPVAPQGQEGSTGKGSTQRNVLPIVLIGSGIALVGAGIGIGFLLASNSTKSDADALGAELDNLGGCGAGTSYKARCTTRLERYDTADTQRNISTVGFVTAGAALAGTIVYVLLPSGKPTSVTAVRPASSVGPNGVSLGIRGAF